MVTIPSKNDGDILYAQNLFKQVAIAASVGSTSSTSETEIGEAVVNANDVYSGIFILVHLKITLPASGKATQTVKIRVGESGTATSNTLVDTYSYDKDQSGANDPVTVVTSQTIHAWYTGATWSNSNFVHITGDATGSDLGNEGTAEVVKIDVIGI